MNIDEYMETLWPETPQQKLDRQVKKMVSTMKRIKDNQIARASK